MTVTAVDKSKRDEFLREAERLLAAEGDAGVRKWLAIAKDVFPQAPDVSLDFIKLLARSGRTGDAERMLRQLCIAHPFRLDLLEILGKWSRSAHGVIGPAPTGGKTCANAADSAYVTVAGNSYVRSFASGTRFFPILIGPGRVTSFLTPDCAAATRRMAFNSLSRVDPGSLVLLVFGNGDALNHLRNDFGTWADVDSGKLPGHEAVIHAAMARYCDMVLEIRERFALNLVLFCAFPMLDVRLKPFIAAINADIHAFGARAGIPVLDLTAKLTDPDTGGLLKEMSTADDNDHVGHELVPMVEQGLDRLGLLPRKNHAFAWDYMFRFAVDPQVEARIWSEPHIGPGNVLHSAKIMFTQIVERAVQVFTGALAIRPGTVLAINGREGFVAFELPPAFALAVTSTDPAGEKALVGRRIARFVGRNVDFRTSPLTDIAAGPAYDYAFMVVHSGDDAAACAAALETLQNKIRKGVFILTALDWSARLAALPGYANIVSLTLSNRLTTGYWAGAKLFALLPEAGA